MFGYFLANLFNAVSQESQGSLKESIIILWFWFVGINDFFNK